jgi:hypothetical protein
MPSIVRRRAPTGRDLALLGQSDHVDGGAFALAARPAILREHYITRDKGAFGSKTQAKFDTTRRVNLMHVHGCAAMDAVFFSAIASDDIEVPLRVKLFALTRRKPLKSSRKDSQRSRLVAGSRRNGNIFNWSRLATDTSREKPRFLGG